MEEAGADDADVEGTRSTVVVVEEDGGADLSLKVSCAGVRETLEGGGRLVFRELRLFFEALSRGLPDPEDVLCRRSGRNLDWGRVNFHVHRGGRGRRDLRGVRGDHSCGTSSGFHGRLRLGGLLLLDRRLPADDTSHQHVEPSQELLAEYARSGSS